jgi:hypothetical protein
MASLVGVGIMREPVVELDHQPTALMLKTNLPLGRPEEPEEQVAQAT